jgi:hypothetical protein
MSRESEHTCHARGCLRLVPPRIFMCRPHWYALPGPLRQRVLDAYQPGQERLDGTAFPSQAYLDAARDAVNWIADHEGAPA